MQNFNQQDNQPPRGSFFNSFGPVGYTTFVLVFIFILYQVIGGILAIAVGGINIDENVSLTRVVQAASQYLFILFPVIFFTRIQTKELKKAFRLNAPKPALLMLSLIGIIAIQPFLQGVMYFQEKLLENIPLINGVYYQLKDIINVIEENTIRLVQAYSVPEFIVVVLVIAITPAICEEMLFRGFVLTNFKKVSRAPIAIFLSGFIFAIYHLNPIELIPLIILGLFLGFITYYSNSIFTAMAAHFFNNLLSAFMLYKFGSEELDTHIISDSTFLDNVIFTVSSLIIFSLIVYLYYKIAKRNLTLIPDE